MRATKIQTAILPTIRSFTENDWLGFAGAELFFDNTAPLIADGEFADGSSWCMIVSGQLSTVLFMDASGEPDRQTECGGYMLDNEFKSADEAREWFSLIRPMLISKKSVLALGFSA